MAICYVAHKYGGDPYNIKVAKKITHDLQTNDLQNTYICPLLALSHLGYKEIGRDEEMELYLVGMEVIYLEEEYGSAQSVKV